MPGKGICTVCAENVTLRKDGMVRAHGYQKLQGVPVPCPGSDRVPRETSDGAFSALCIEADNEPTVALVWTGASWDSMCVKHAKKALRAS